MRRAPPVQVRCSGAAWRVLQVLLMALAAGVCALWLLLHAELRAWPAAAAAVLAGTLAWRLLRVDAVDLVWDGQRWLASGQAGAVDVMLDFGGCMLLRLRADEPAGLPQGRFPECEARRHPGAPAPGRWIAVSPADAGAALHGLRAALYSHAPPDPTAGPDTMRSR